MRYVDYKSHLYYNETMDWKEAIKRSLGKPYKVKMYLMQEIVWNYGAGVACKKTLSPRNEKWHRSSEERTNHPAQFPLDLIDRITLGFSNANDILLDNGKSFSNCCVISNHFEESTFSYGLFIFTASYFVNT